MNTYFRVEFLPWLRGILKSQSPGRRALVRRSECSLSDFTRATAAPREPWSYHHVTLFEIFNPSNL